MSIATIEAQVVWFQTKMSVQSLEDVVGSIVPPISFRSIYGAYRTTENAFIITPEKLPSRLSYSFQSCIIKLRDFNLNFLRRSPESSLLQWFMD